VRLGEAILTTAFLALYFAVVAGSWGSFFWLHATVGSAAILFPTYLVVLLMWRHRWERKPKKNGDWSGEL
jgi:F0F1-type ATP synthase assembly protein I